MTPEDFERTLFAMKTVEKKIDELRSMGAEVPRVILDQFHSLLKMLKSTKTGEELGRHATSESGPGREKQTRWGARDEPRNNDKDRGRGKEDSKKDNRPRFAPKKPEPVIGKRPKGKPNKPKEQPTPAPRRQGAVILQHCHRFITNSLFLVLKILERYPVEHDYVFWDMNVYRGSSQIIKLITDTFLSCFEPSYP
jgi:hypothetical protein